MLFNPEINSIEEDILYHETQIKEAEERLDQVKMSQAYSDTVISSLEDFIDNTDPFLYEVLRGHLNQMFDGNKITLNNDFKQVKKEEVFTSPVVEDAETGPKVFNPSQPDIPHAVEEDEEAHLIHLRDNVVFDEDTDCIQIGFRLSSDGYEWQNQLVCKQKLSSKSWFEEAEHLEDYPKELIIEGLSLEQAKEITKTCDFTNPPIKEPVEAPATQEELSEKPHYPDPKIPIKLADYKPGMTPVNKVEIAPGIIYIPVDKTAYIAMKAKGRARNYGDMLTRVLDIGSKYIVSDKPCVARDAKYEFRLFDIELEDIKQLAKFNLSKEYDAKQNKEVREIWRTTRQRPAPVTTKPSPKLVSLEDVKLGDIVYLNSIDNQYKVLSKVELDGTPHLEVINVFNSERPSLVSNISYLKECYLVPVDEIRIDPQFKEVEQEEVLTEDVQIYIPVSEKTKVKKSEELSEQDFSPGPYNSIELTELEFGDSITSTPHSKSAYEVIAVNKEYATAVCLYHQALPGRVGEQYTFANPYLVEKCNQEMLVTA